MSDFKKEIKTVYKYRDWSKEYHKSILTQNKMYFPSPQELNDPFDFQLHLDFKLIDSEFKLEILLNCFVRDYYITDNPSNKDLKGIIKDLKEIVEAKNKLYAMFKSNLSAFSKEYHDLMTHFFKRFGILCLSKDWNNILLWSHYSNNHTGFCVGFNNSKIETLAGMGGDVSYPIHYPQINPLDLFEKDVTMMKTIFQLTTTKSIDWKYENEYRHLKLWDYEPPVQERIFVFDNSYIDEIILGLNISFDNEKEIRRICDSRSIPVFKIKKTDSQFILDRENL